MAYEMPLGGGLHRISSDRGKYGLYLPFDRLQRMESINHG